MSMFVSKNKNDNNKNSNNNGSSTKTTTATSTPTVVVDFAYAQRHGDEVLPSGGEDEEIVGSARPVLQPHELLLPVDSDHFPLDQLHAAVDGDAAQVCRRAGTWTEIARLKCVNMFSQSVKVDVPIQ